MHSAYTNHIENDANNKNESLSYINTNEQK
jgi:hypothetical protein